MAPFEKRQTRFKAFERRGDDGQSESSQLRIHPEIVFIGAVFLGCVINGLVVFRQLLD